MRKSSVTGVRLAGLASAVPIEKSPAQEEAEVFGLAETQKIAASTGINGRRLAVQGVCASDLCLEASVTLLESLGWERSSVDALVFVTQSPDYLLPATACSLHGRLGLDPACAAFDVNLGCSGHTYGIWMISHLIASGAVRRALLLTGDTARMVGREDRSARLLFGDAGTATAFEASPGAPPIHFRVGTDGSGQNELIIPAGGFRLPRAEGTGRPTAEPDGNIRSLDDLYMNGTEIFLFTIARVPSMIRETLKDAAWSIDDVDSFVLHQANQFILKHLAKTMKLPAEKVPFSLGDFGNTSSASIPLTMSVTLGDALRERPQKLVLAGFGVGLSWSSVAIETDRIVAPPLVEVPTTALRDRLFALEEDAASHLPLNLRKAFHDDGRA